MPHFEWCFSLSAEMGATENIKKTQVPMFFLFIHMEGNLAFVDKPTFTSAQSFSKKLLSLDH